MSTDPAEKTDEGATGADATPAEKADAGGREFTVSSRSLLRGLGALVAVAALVVIGVLSWQYVAKSRTLSAFDEAKGAASSFVVTYFDTMMAPTATPEEIQAKITPLTTGDARERVETEAKSTVAMVQEAKLANITVDVTAVSVESFTADRATTLVGATLKGTSALEPAGGQQVLLLQIDLAKEGDDWLVSQMIPQQGASVSAQTPGPVPQPAPEPQPGG